MSKWKAENPDATPSLKHGAYSQRVHKRYKDGRYLEAKQLRGVMKSLIEDLGGSRNVTAAQRLLLDNVRSKLIVLLQISKYVERQESIINDKGEILPCLGRNYTSFSEGLRRDLLALSAMGKKPTPVSYDKALQVLEEGKGES